MRSDLTVLACFDPMRACRRAAALTGMGKLRLNVADLVRDLCTLWPVHGDDGPAARTATSILLASQRYCCPITGEPIDVPVRCPRRYGILSLRGLCYSMGIQLEELLKRDEDTMEAAEAQMVVDPAGDMPDVHLLEARIDLGAARELVRLRCCDAPADPPDRAVRRLMLQWLDRLEDVERMLRWQDPGTTGVPREFAVRGTLLQASKIARTLVWTQSLAVADRWAKARRLSILQEYNDLDWTDQESVRALQRGDILIGADVRITPFGGDMLKFHFVVEERRSMQTIAQLEVALQMEREHLRKLRGVVV